MASNKSKLPNQNMKMALIVAVSVIVGVIGTVVYQRSFAAASCPGGSTFAGGRGGGVCIDKITGDIVKTIR